MCLISLKHFYLNYDFLFDMSFESENPNRTSIVGYLRVGC
jgi:hypothetical protein